MHADHSSTEDAEECTPAQPEGGTKQSTARGKARGMVLRWALLKAMGPDRWHFAALLNQGRYEAFRGAIQRALEARGGTASVLDFGAVPGLLACTAEQLGASPVTRLERLRPLAKLEMAMAREAGLSLRVLSDIPGEDSSDEDDDTDGTPNLPARQQAADIAVMEVWEPTFFGGQEVGILGHGVVDALRRVRRAGLVSSTTTLIPRRAIIRAQLLHLPAQTELLRCPLAAVSGFDLSPFSRFCPDGAEPAYLARLRHAPLAPPFTVFTFDMGGEVAAEEEAEVEVEVTAGGVCNAVAFWHDVQLDDVSTLSAGPESQCRQAVVMLRREARVAAGGRVRVRGRRAGEEVKFEVEGGEEAGRHEGAGSVVVQRWHFGMLNDSERNDAFDRALQRRVRRGDTVIDVGAGTGLLGMMAARAGAGRVLCCEKSKVLGPVAQDIVRRNGFETVVKVVAKHSKELLVGPPPLFLSGAGWYAAPGRDMAGRAQVLVAEIVDCGLLGEGVVPTLLHARERLLTPNAALIPCGAQVYAQAVSCPLQAAPLSRPLSALYGHDMAWYSQFASPAYEQIRLSEIEHTPLTPVVPVFHFDFASSRLGGSRGGWQQWPVTASGQVDAVVFWFTLELDDQVSLSTGPDNPSTCWKQALQFMHPPLAASAGSPLSLWVSHDLTRISFAPAPPPPDSP